MARFKFRKGCLTFYVYAVREVGRFGFFCVDDLRTILQSVVNLNDFLDHTYMLAMPNQRTVFFLSSSRHGSLNNSFGGRRRSAVWLTKKTTDMEFLRTVLQVLLFLFLIASSGLLSAIFYEAYRRRFSNRHAEAPVILEDPNSLKQVTCPSIFNPAEKYLSLIIPAFNEEHRLPGALKETMNYLQQRAMKDKSFSYEVMIVDDGSADGTKRVAFDFVRKHTVENVRVLALGRNHGKGEAIRKGMLHSRGEMLLMLDADGATKVNDLEKLENQILNISKKEGTSSKSGFRLSDVPAVAFGSRAHLEDKALATRKWYRNFLMKGFHLVVLLTAGPGIRDTQCGFKMFTRSAARKLFTNIRLKRWCFDVELVFLCKWFKIPMIEVSVNWSEIPGSKVNLMSIPNMLWELALMSAGYRTGIWKIC